MNGDYIKYSVKHIIIVKKSQFFLCVVWGGRLPLDFHPNMVV